MRIAVLVSGAGTNLAAILARAGAGELGAEVAVVVSDRAGAGALDRAHTAGVPTEVVPWQPRQARDANTERLCAAAARHGAEALVLAGFMRILGPVAMQRFPQAILNVHPSLLPAFPGARAVEQALEGGVKVTGVTVHFVDEQVDHGPIVAQEAVPVLPGDDAATLHARIQAVEHRLYPEVIAAFAAGRLAVDGHHVTGFYPGRAGDPEER